MVYIGLTEQVSDGCVDVSQLLGQQWRPLSVAVVFHQASIQEHLELEQRAGGEGRLLRAGVGLWTLTCRKEGKQRAKASLKQC